MSLLINIVKMSTIWLTWLSSSLSTRDAIYFNRSTKPPDVTSSSNVNLLSSCLGWVNNSAIDAWRDQEGYFLAIRIYLIRIIMKHSCLCVNSNNFEHFPQSKDKSVVSFICINPERGNFEDFPRIKHVFTFLDLITCITHHCIKRIESSTHYLN